MRICTKCKLEKSEAEFRSNGRDYTLWCTSCIMAAREQRRVRRQKITQCIIYGLFDPRTEECLYVGYTSQSPVTRVAQHLQDARRAKPGKSPKHDWLCDLMDNDLMPEFRVLEKSPVDTAVDREAFWIGAMLNQGVPLLNAFGYSKEQIAKRAARRKLPNG